MLFKISNEIMIQEPTKKIINYCNNNLVLDNPKYQANERMGFWNGNTPKQLQFYKKNGNDLILPFGCIDDLTGQIIENDYETDFADKPAKFISSGKIKLYDYQENAVKAMVKAKNGIFTSATGSGKTITALSIIGAVGQKTLWCCHTRELMKQALDSYKIMYEYQYGDIGIIKEGSIEIGNKITFAVVHTLCKADIDKYEFGFVFVDEAQFAIKSIENTAMFSKCMEMFAARYKQAATAMVHRADSQEKRITMLFGNVKHEVPREVVADKIMTCKIEKIDTKTLKSFEYLKIDGTMDFCKLQNYLAENDNRNSLIAEMADNLVSRGHSVLILCDRIIQIQSIYNKLGDYAVIVTGSMTSKKGKAEREKAIENMRNGNKKCLIASVKLAGTGLDIACLDSLLWVSIQKDEGIITQAVGRISRSKDGKENPIFYDFVDENIGYCVSAYNKRKRQYKKIGCILCNGKTLKN